MYFYDLFLTNQALTCRSEHGPRKEELRKVFNNCVRQQQGRPNENRRQTSDNEWRNQGENQRNPWENNNRNDNWEDRNSNRNNNKDRDRNGDYRGNNNGRNVGQNNKNENRGSDGRYEMSSGNGRDDRMNINGNRGANGGRNDNVMNSYGTTQHLRGQDEFLESEEYGVSVSYILIDNVVQK